MLGDFAVSYGFLEIVKVVIGMKLGGSDFFDKLTYWITQISLGHLF